MRAIPWWGKIAAKLLLARLPFGYEVWQKLGIFRHGQMDTSSYALSVFRMHVEYAQLGGELDGKTILELGPGDGIATALLGAAYGARAILVDTGAYVRAQMPSIRSLAEQLRVAGLKIPDISSCTNLVQVFEACNARYLTKGLDSLREIPDASIDLIFSQSVLEHVRRRDFSETIFQCRRVLASRGSFSNHVDLKDHLGGALNNLRFSETIWESNLFADSGFYTNRIRYSDMLQRFRDAGFAVEWTKPILWKCVPTPRKMLDSQFQTLSDEELKVSGFDVLLR